MWHVAATNPKNFFSGKHNLPFCRPTGVGTWQWTTLTTTQSVSATGVLGWLRALVSAFMGGGYRWARLAGNGAVSGLGGKGEVAAFEGMTKPARQCEQLSQALLGSGAIGHRASKTMRTSTWLPLGFKSHRPKVRNTRVQANCECQQLVAKGSSRIAMAEHFALAIFRPATVFRVLQACYL